MLFILFDWLMVALIDVCVRVCVHVSCNLTPYSIKGKGLYDCVMKQRQQPRFVIVAFSMLVVKLGAELQLILSNHLIFLISILHKTSSTSPLIWLFQCFYAFCKSTTLPALSTLFIITICCAFCRSMPFPALSTFFTSRLVTLSLFTCVPYRATWKP